MTEPKKPLRWQDLTGQERYQVIELMRRPEVNIQELCRTFGVSRQKLYRAAEQADKAAVSALEVKPRGRKPVAEPVRQAQELATRNKDLAKQLEKMTQRYEVAQTLLDLQRQLDRGEPLPGEKKTLRQPGRPIIPFGS